MQNGNTYITQRTAGRYLSRRSLSFKPKGDNIMRLNASEYCVKRTGEIKEFKITAKSREDNIYGVKKRCNEFKWLIRANVKDIRLFVTLTYKENMTDTKRLYSDFKAFFLRLKRAYPFLKDYFVAFEPQERGSWHAHMILLSKFPLFLSNRKISRIWGFGFVRVQALKGINSVANYLTSYLTNIKDGQRTKKGGRLSLYPPFFRFLRFSKGIKKYEERTWWGRVESIPNLDCADLLYDHFYKIAVSESVTMEVREFLILYSNQKLEK